MNATTEPDTSDAVARLLDRKRSYFCDDYQLKIKPSLIWQCYPDGGLALDLENEQLRAAFVAGGGQLAEDGWWYGFKQSSRPKLIFDGLAVSTDSADSRWATELHADGHVFAAVWTFPDCRRGGGDPTLGVGDFYVDAFRDFAFMCDKIYRVVGYEGDLHLTTTMHLANQLPLVNSRGDLISAASKRQTLCWPVAVVKVKDLADAGTAMASQFMRIFGRKLR